MSPNILEHRCKSNLLYHACRTFASEIFYCLTNTSECWCYSGVLKTHIMIQ